MNYGIFEFTKTAQERWDELQAKYNSLEYKQERDYLQELERLPKEDWRSAYRILKGYYRLIEERLKDPMIKVKHINVFESPIWKFMNEAERTFYDIIYSIGTIALYPLYYVDGFYLDFGNPYLKVGIEIDGKAFHDEVKDRKRDLKLTESGWVIYRIPASQVFARQTEIEDFETIEIEDGYEEDRYKAYLKYYLKDVTGFSHAFRAVHMDSCDAEDEIDMYSIYNCALESLQRRRLVW